MNNLFRLELPTQALQDSYQIGLVMTTYNRPHFLRRCLDTLHSSFLDNVIILLVDDGSDDEETLAILHSFSIPNVPIIKAFRLQKDGCRMYENLCYGWDLLCKQYACTYLCNLDSDTIVKKHWLSELQAVYEIERPAQGPLIVTGFNAEPHPIIKPMKRYYVKKSIGGINLFFDQMIYDEIVRPHLTDIYWDWQVVEAMHEHNYPILCTRPSVIQHIGQEGLWSSPHRVYDVAIDYWGTNPKLMMLVRWYFLVRKLIAISRYAFQKLGKLLLLKRFITNG
jgi:glycosyltransferase involved in cell wall biosynthesis